MDLCKLKIKFEEYMLFANTDSFLFLRGICLVLGCAYSIFTYSIDIDKMVHISLVIPFMSKQSTS